jgi:hypothetical protein
VGRFVPRDEEMREIKQRLLEEQSMASRRKVVVVHGLGGIGKTQLAAEFAREHHERFSSVFWLDGSSEASVKQSFARIFQRLPQDELAVAGVGMLQRSTVDVDTAIRVCLQWLSLSSNRHWLLIFDNVDRDHNDKDDSQAYDVKQFLPHTDHGSVLVTSRLASLRRYGLELKVGTLDAEQARAVLDNNAGKVVEGKWIILLANTKTSSLMCAEKMRTLFSSFFTDFLWPLLKLVRIFEKQTCHHQHMRSTMGTLGNA